MTAITVTDEVQKAFGAMKDDKKHKVRVLVLSIDPSEKVVVDTQWEDEGKGMTPEQMGQRVSETYLKNARYFVYDFSYNTKEDGKRDKLLFLSWIPGTLKPKEKMLYAGTRNNVKQALQGISKDVELTELSDFSTKAFLERLNEDLSKIAL